MIDNLLKHYGQNSTLAIPLTHVSDECDAAPQTPGMRSMPVIAERRVLLRFLVAISVMLMSAPGMAGGDAAANASTSPRIPLAVIGDSDSQGFQDLYPADLKEVPRGGKYHATTFQWTEALARMRGQQLDLGDWGVHGMGGHLANAIEWVGLSGAAESIGWEVRAPKKRDHRFNFAFSGNGCADLFGGWSRQVPRLVRLMDKDPVRWRDGIVVIKIGGNDFANDVPDLDRLASDPASPEVRRKMDFCLGEIGRAVAAIQQKHPQTHIMLGGVFNNANWDEYRDHWHSPQMLANIATGLNHFDDALQRLVAADPRLAFFSDRRWFDALWGARDRDGLPNYRTLVLSSAVQIVNTAGDAPRHATLADGHAGLVWNAKWAQALVDLISTRWNLKITPISDAEVLDFVLATGAFKNPN